MQGPCRRYGWRCNPVGYQPNNIHLPNEKAWNLREAVFLKNIIVDNNPLAVAGQKRGSRKSPLQCSDASDGAIHAAPFALRGVIETDSNQDLSVGIPAQLLKRFLLIFSDRILDSRVDRGMPSIAAAPDDPNTRPSLSRRADSINSFS